MSILDGKPFFATKKQCKNWGGGGDAANNFRCYLCGKKFEPGDVVRCQHTNNIPGIYGNPLVCQDCDGPDVIQKWKEKWDLMRSPGMWWFRGR